MIKNVSFKENILTVISESGDRKDIDIGARVLKVVFTDIYVVMLLNWMDVNNTQYHNRNIICLNEEGKTLWRIVNQDTLSPSKEKTHYARSSLELKNNDCIRAGTIFGTEVDVGIHTGDLMGNWEFTK